MSIARGSAGPPYSMVLYSLVFEGKRRFLDIVVLGRFSWRRGYYIVQCASYLLRVVHCRGSDVVFFRLRHGIFGLEY